MIQKEHYTFGDSDLAATRLRLLARVFEPSSARLLERLRSTSGEVAVDLGCGPGHTTRLLAEHVAVASVIGFDQSKKLLAAAAREHPGPRLSFVECDVTQPPFPAPPAAALYARFLLTHLRDPLRVLRAWADAALPGAQLVLEETAFMTAEHPALSRYYALVERMQKHYGQRMYIGRELAALARGSARHWVVEHSEIAVSLLSAADMARLHLLNLRTWSEDPFARANYEGSELSELGLDLEQVASGTVESAPVSLGMGQLVLRRV
ncbi:MAG TPA: methyltransferase domain-containing protein [Polyangiaceae bacterium]|jgi:trans-aconitate 2-methyltransferase|nr:methyltransferase domain-containing protein [Polyangiaceae bacterium]